MARNVPASKIILDIADYGYDWSSKITDSTETLTYQQALVTARESDAVVDFDNDTYCAHFQYYDDKDNLHDVNFADAATDFNAIRFATEYGLAGTALMRLGSEDSRLLDFYDLPMTRTALHKFDFNEFNKVEGSRTVDYIGEQDFSADDGASWSRESWRRKKRGSTSNWRRSKKQNGWQR